MNSDDTESNLPSKIKRTVEANEDDPLISKKLKISAESILSLDNYETRTAGKSNNDFKSDKDPCSSETLKNELSICCSTSDPDTSRLPKFEENETDKENVKPEIFQLSYADFLYIFEFLSTNDLVALSETCRYFRDLITNRSRSWKSIQTVCVVNDNSAHTRIYKYLNHSIEHFELRMEPPLYERMRYGPIQCFTANSFIRIMNALTNLKSIAIIYHSIGDPINISYFPKSITEIRFKGVYISVAEDLFFYGIQHYLPNVQVIELDNIGWLNGNVLYSFAKLPALKKLSITNCLLMTDLVPYACIACQHGFYVLETLDLRRCPVTDRDIISFKPLKTLKHMYLERPYGYYGSISNNFFITFNQSELHIDTETGIVLVDRIRKVNYVLETLVVRNYRQVTDEIINGCKLYIPNLKYLDVSGTSCTVEAVEAFKRERPGVTVKYENLHSDDDEQSARVLEEDI